MKGTRATTAKFTVFCLVMTLFTVALIFTFGQFRTGPTTSYSAVFADASRVKVGDSVRVAGVRVGTIKDVALQPDLRVLLTFDADRDVVLTDGTKAAIRYLNLVGDRYLELIDGPGSTRRTPPGARIPLERTAPALDLDLLLGGLKPVLKGLNPEDVNALTASLLQILQGQGGTLDSLLSNASSFAAGLGENSAAIERVIDNLNTLVTTLAKNGDEFAGSVDRLEKLITGLAQDRDPIGAAITSLSEGTASIADLLGEARAPLKGTVDQLGRLAPLLDGDKARLESALQKAPANYRKLVRLGSYGSFIQYYICGITFRVTDLQGRTAVFPWTKQEGGRCSEP